MPQPISERPPRNQAIQRRFDPSPFRRVAMAGIFWIGLTALSVLAVAAIGAMSTVIG